MDRKHIIINGVNASPGTTVLLIAPEYMSTEDIVEVKRELESRFAGVTFFFLSGDIQLIGSYPTAEMQEIEA